MSEIEETRLSLVLPGETQRCEIIVQAGAARRLAFHLAAHAPAHAYAVIADDRVAALHADRVIRPLEAAGLDARLYTFPAGETSKTAVTWAGLLESLAADGLGRDGCVVGLGGGVACDLAGFVAATFLRGVSLVQVPTSLLAMVDAAIGGKTGVDLAAGKNLAGAFWQPRVVVADPELLGTLPLDELRAGLAEAVKHGAIADRAGFAWLESNGRAVLSADPVALRRIVADSIRVKTAFVADDVLEAGARAVLNFGHTIAHAIEHITSYSVAHGPAVAIGMVVEARIGEHVGVTEPGTAARIGALLTMLGLPASPPAGLDLGAIVAATATDKKARRGSVRYSLIREIGAAARTAEGSWTREVPEKAVLAALGRA